MVVQPRESAIASLSASEGEQNQIQKKQWSNITDRSGISSGVTAEVFEMIFDIKAETEEDVVPQEHLHPIDTDQHGGLTASVNNYFPQQQKTKIYRLKK